MLIHRDINNLPDFKHAVITTGTFDGVHGGHLKIINQVKDEAARIKGESVLITFFPHPRLVLQKKDAAPLKLLTTFDEKMELLGKTGVDHVVVVPFTHEFSQMAAEDYVTEFLVKKLKPKCIITGYDHHFGRNRKGDFLLLQDFGKKFHFSVKEIPEYVLQEVIISSTRIRKALSEGDIITANECLGYDYFIDGTVIHGNKIGRTLGYPTANIGVENKNKLVPKYGIYIVGISKINAEDDSRIYPAMMSIGIRPTLKDNNHETIEANIFDFNEELYGKSLRVHFKRYIRPELKFDNLEQLREKMKEDEKISRTFWRI